MKKVFGQIVKILLTLLILYFVFKQLQNHWTDISEHDWKINPLLAAASLLVGIFSFYLHSSMWKPIIKCFGHDISSFTAFRIMFLANLGRYIPGKVWQLFGVIYLTKKEGISVEESGSSFALMQLFSFPASVLVFLIAAQFESRLLDDQIRLLGQKSVWLLGIGALFSAVWIIAFPQKAIGLLNWILAKLKRPSISLQIPITTALKIFVGYCVAWVVYGLAFWLFVLSVSAEKIMGPVAAVGAYILAHQIGYAAIFAPGGLGPRELILQLQLAPFFGPITPAIVILARIWSIVLESLAAILALILGKIKKSAV